MRGKLEKNYLWESRVGVEFWQVSLRKWRVGCKG